MSFFQDQALMIDNIFEWRGEECRIYCDSIAQPVIGIYRDPFREQGAGELIIGMNEPSLRLKNSDTVGYNVRRGTKVEIVNGGICLTVEQAEPNDDGTTYYKLRKGWE